MFTTLNKIKAHNPCAEGWKKGLAYLGKTEADDEPLSMLAVLDAVGLEHALWCLRAVDGFGREKRLFAVWCARRVQHLMTDDRSISALDVAERFANGSATEDELAAAGAAARAAAWAAAWAAEAAAWAAAWAAEAAAWAAEAAARAAGAAAWAAEAAARDAEREAQEAEFRRIVNAAMREYA